MTVICFRVDENSMSSWYMCFEMVAKHVTHLLLITRIHLAHKNTDHQDEGCLWTSYLAHFPMIYRTKFRILFSSSGFNFYEKRSQTEQVVLLHVVAKSFVCRNRPKACWTFINSICKLDCKRLIKPSQVRTFWSTRSWVIKKLLNKNQ